MEYWVQLNTIIASGSFCMVKGTLATLAKGAVPLRGAVPHLPSAIVLVVGRTQNLSKSIEASCLFIFVAVLGAALFIRG